MLPSFFPMTAKEINGIQTDHSIFELWKENHINIITFHNYKYFIWKGTYDITAVL